MIDGCPSRMALSPEDFIPSMARRRPGRTPLDTPRREEDRVEILSGVFEGETTGAPIALFIRNRDADSRPYEVLRDAFRPGHADYSYFRKYGHIDFPGRRPFVGPGNRGPGGGRRGGPKDPGAGRDSGGGLDPGIGRDPGPATYSRSRRE